MRYSKQILKIFFAIFFLIIIVFGVYRLSPILQGPEVEIYNLENGEIKNGTFLEIKGSSKNLHKLYINGSLTEIEKTGNFETRLALFPKNNILQIVGVDKFGREIKKTYNIYSQ
jgi:hypothetical protein